MNWDAVINIGMFALGCCFVIVAMAQLLFGNYDDDDCEVTEMKPRRYRPYCKHGKDGGMVEGRDCEICAEGDDEYDALFEKEMGYKPYSDDEMKAEQADFEWAKNERAKEEALMSIDAGLNQVQTDITEQDNPMVAVMMIRAASEVAQAIIDENDKDCKD